MEQKLSNKERMEMFQSGVSQLTSENEVSNVRELLRQRYLKNKEEEDAKRKKLEEERAARREEQEKKTKELDTSYMGRQLARVFRFGKTSNVRQRLNAQANRGLRRRVEVDPFDDPNVLLENFGFHNDEHDEGQQLLLDAAAETDEDIEDDSFRSLVRHFWQPLTRGQLAWMLFKIGFYVVGQAWAYKKGFGAPFFAISLLVFICTNLRKKAPGELSAYSVFNPFCQNIPSTAGREQPQDNIVLGFGQL